MFQDLGEHSWFYHELRKPRTHTHTKTKQLEQSVYVLMSLQIISEVLKYFEIYLLKEKLLNYFGNIIGEITFCTFRVICWLQLFWQLKQSWNNFLIIWIYWYFPVLCEDCCVWPGLLVKEVWDKLYFDKVLALTSQKYSVSTKEMYSVE